jgi:opacity protein-like surface antigen
MGSAKSFLFAGAITLVTLPAAHAADLPSVMPVKAPVVYDYSGWYLRGDIGMTNQRLDKISNSSWSGQTWFDTGSFDSGMFFGLGVGYQLNNWLRFDVTGEYRGKTQFHALDSYGGGTGSNEYTASKSEWVVLGNAYVDLGTWWSVTPFVGAGVGVAYNKIDHYRDINTLTSGGGWADSGTKTNLAWAAHAGLAYKVTPGLTLELAYRYLWLGDAQTDDTKNLDGSNPIANNPTIFNGIYSHDLKFGVRWMLEPEPVYAPSLMRKG